MSASREHCVSFSNTFGFSADNLVCVLFVGHVGLWVVSLTSNLTNRGSIADEYKVKYP